MSSFYSFQIKITDSFDLRIILPFSSITVAYLELANGHEFLLHKPVTLYSFLQNVFVTVLYLKRKVLCLIRTMTVVDNFPDNVVYYHFI